MKGYSASTYGWDVKAEITSTGEVKMTRITRNTASSTLSPEVGVCSTLTGTYVNPDSSGFEPDFDPAGGYFVQLVVKQSDVTVS